MAEDIPAKQAFGELRYSTPRSVAGHAQPAAASRSQGQRAR